ncbi:MAG TPA: hypothetical protein VHO03_00215 [Ignavibacteriales bacterium]|nr:hypothetical protein [Ignavibacteriales bacterium]
MKRSEMDEKLLNRVISAAYKDATLLERLLIRWKAAWDPEVKRLYQEYKTTARQVHSLFEEACPGSVLSRVEKLTLPEERKQHSFLLDIYGAVFSKPVWSAAMVLIMVSALALSIFLRQNKQPVPYSQKEIALANEQASEALKMVGSILNETKSTVINEILPEKVSRPINEGFSTVRNLINKETTDEKVN